MRGSEVMKKRKPLERERERGIGLIRDWAEVRHIKRGNLRECECYLCVCVCVRESVCVCIC